MNEDVIDDLCKHIDIQDLIRREINIDIFEYEWVKKLTTTEYQNIRDIIFDSVNDDLDDIENNLDKYTYVESRCLELLSEIFIIVEEYYLEAKIEVESKHLFNRVLKKRY